MVKKRGRISKSKIPKFPILFRDKNKKQIKSKFSKIPIGVKIIAAFFFINAAFTIIFGLTLIIGTIVKAPWTLEQILEKFLSLAPDEIQSVTKILTSLTFIGILFIIFGIVDFFIGWGLWKTKPWARILTIALMVFLLISSIFSFDYFLIIFSAVIGGYLLLSPGVAKAFQK